MFGSHDQENWEAIDKQINNNLQNGKIDSNER